MNEALGANFEKGSESKSEAKKVSNFVIVKPADVSMETTNEQSAVPEQMALEMRIEALEQSMMKQKSTESKGG